jgi:acetylglutamate kinase
VTASRRDVVETQAKAGTLIAALPYIQQFAGTTFVIKVGGEIADDPDGAASFVRDLVILKHVGIDVVLCHGGGPQITRMMQSLGTEARFVDGLRVTDPATMEITAMVLLGEVNRRLVTSLNVHGPLAVGISGVDARLFEVAERDPALGLVGDVVAVNPAPVQRLLDDGYIPVVATIGADTDGVTYNVNADSAAGALAAALGAEKFVVFTNVEGLYETFGDEDSLISEIDLEGLRTLADGGTLGTGMVPKVDAIITALAGGVGAAHILDGRVRHAVLLEIFTDEGIGTKITTPVDGSGS